MRIIYDKLSDQKKKKKTNNADDFLTNFLETSI